MKRPKTSTLLLWLALLGFTFSLLFTPWLLEGLDRDIYKQWMQGPQEEWTGILRLFHVIDWRPGGSGLGWIEKRVIRFEKRHKGVFIEVEALTKEAAAARIATGEMPDILSFPPGFASAEWLDELDGINAPLIRPLKNVGNSDGRTYALAFMLSGYVAIINEDLANERNVELPEDISSEWLREAAEKMTFTRGRGKWASERVGISLENPLPLYKTGYFPLGKRAPLESFMSGRVGIAVTDLRACYDLARRDEAGKAFPHSVFPLADFSDEVQLVGISRALEPVKKAYAQGFIDELLSPTAQQDLKSINALSVIELELPLYSDGVMAALEAGVGEMAIPPAFGYDALYAELAALAEAAVAGNPDAEKQLEAALDGLIDK